MILTFCPTSGRWQSNRCATTGAGRHYSVFLSLDAAATILNELGRLAAESPVASLRAAYDLATRGARPI